MRKWCRKDHDERKHTFHRDYQMKREAGNGNGRGKPDGRQKPDARNMYSLLS